MGKPGLDLSELDSVHFNSRAMSSKRQMVAQFSNNSITFTHKSKERVAGVPFIHLILDSVQSRMMVGISLAMVKLQVNISEREVHF